MIAVDFTHQIGVLAQVIFGILASLADADIAVGEECAALLDDFELGRQIENITGLGDALVEHDVELGSAERRRHLVLDHLDAGAIADHFVADLDRLDAAHVQTHGGIELERLTAGGGFRVAEHHADLLAQLVCENDSGLGLVDCARKLAECLRHQAGLHTHAGIAHVTFDLRTRARARQPS